MGTTAPKLRRPGYQRSRLGAWYDKLVTFDLAAVFSKKHVPGPARTIFVNQDLPKEYFNEKGKVKKEHVYITNQVITSKYTVITFLPRNLLEQFRRIANIFFAAIAILQFFHLFSTVSPGLVVLPLIIVLTITALKDGYEDIKRHQSDKRVNQSQVRVLAGGGWVNPNAGSGKSKTFVRGIVPKALRGGAKSKKQQKQTTGDVEMLERGAPPEAVSSRREPEEPGMDNGDREFDDEVEEAHHGLFHHHHQGADRAHWLKTSWEDLKVGDVVKVMNNEPLPADVLICATSEDENVAYVETKNLDGETNLKSRNAVPALTWMRTARAAADVTKPFTVYADKPDPNMYKLNAAVEMEDEKSPVDLQMTLLRGTVLRNTGWVIGIVMFTGEDTKIVLNSGGTPSKRSKVERQMNPQVFANLGLLACMAIACGVVDSQLEGYYYPRDAPWLYGADESDNNPKINGLITAIFALITFQNVVPISLYISIEAVRTIQAAFIYFDKEIWYDKTDTPTLARSWNLSDDLGQIEYIFSDKTGTLTQNSMVFRECSIGGRDYRGDEEMQPGHEGEPAGASKEKRRLTDSDSSSTTAGTSKVPDPMQADGVKLSEGVLQHFKDSQLSADIERARALDESASSEDATWARAVNGFFTVLALCHTVLTAVDPETGAIEYKAQSPDEAALVQAAADVGFVFRGREKEILRLQTPFAEEVQQFELLNILEFSSSRKRMGVIVRKLGDDDNRVFLLSKGADNVIFERLRPGEDDLKHVTTNHLDDFANHGLRTLTLAYKVIPDDQYEDWSQRYHEASVAIDGREEKIEAVSDEIERDLRLLGATAIEDRLQDGVPETIADLKRAGIKIWVATGDKLETAIAIGHSTNLIQPDSNIIVVRGNSETGRPVYEQLLKAVDEFFPDSGILEDEFVNASALEGGRQRLGRLNSDMSSVVGHGNGDRPGGFVLVIDGAALTQALSDEQHKYLLLSLGTRCEGVICCRVSPMQKALVTKLVKDGLGVVTLAIGDGANDVSMIQAADVGVGISGEEGLQAVNSSDYAIAQFRFLKRLLLVHGHWSYSRNGQMIVNFFYKNLLCIGVLWWFQIYCGWSSAYVFEYTYLLFWNSFWTIAPVIALGLFDRIVDDDVLMGLPELYRFGREGTWFGFRLFMRYALEAVFQSVIIYFFIQYTYQTTASRENGLQTYIYEFSSVMILSAVITADLFVGLNTHVWTWWVFFAVALGIVLVSLWTVIYSAISPGWIVTPIYGNNERLWPSAYFWFGLLFTVCLCLAPRYIAKAIKFGYFPDDLDIMRFNRKMYPDRDLAHDAQPSSALSALKAPASRSSRSLSSRVRAPTDPRIASRTDMATGLRSVHRGFDFMTEENGVAIQRIQTNLSSRHASNLNVSTPHQRKRSATLLSQFRKSIHRKKPPTPEGGDPPPFPASLAPPPSHDA